MGGGAVKKEQDADHERRRGRGETEREREGGENVCVLGMMETSQFQFQDRKPLPFTLTV